MFLEEAKSAYYEQAQLIPGWQDLDRNELCRKYVEIKKSNPNDDRLDLYFSAIMYKFWNVIQHKYYQQQQMIATPEDCHDWAVDSIMFVLQQHAWDDPKSSLYKDQSAPEKAINVCIKNTQMNFFVAQNRHKRVLNHTAYSLDELLENSSDDYYLPCEDNYDFLAKSFDKYILDSFNEREYLKAFVVYSLIHSPQLVENQQENNLYYNTVNYTKLKQYLLASLNEKFAKEFAERYGLTFGVVFNAVMSIYYCGEECVTVKILQAIIENLKDDVLIQELRY